MTDTKPDVAEKKRAAEYIRINTGHLLSRVIVKSDTLQFERHCRSSKGSMNWYFKQPRLAFLCHGPGIDTGELVIDGVVHKGGATDRTTVTIVPPNTSVEGVFKVSNNADMYADYSIVFLNNEFVNGRSAVRIDRPVVMQSAPALASRVQELGQEVSNRDNLFDLYAEGWACQVLVMTSRLLGDCAPLRVPAQGGMTRLTVRRIEEFIDAHLDGELRLDELAAVAGLSKHHFLRTFRQTTGATPHQYVLAARIRRAKQKLTAAKGGSITDIAMACGFSNSQNFSTIFRKATGLTPSKFRLQSFT